MSQPQSSASHKRKPLLLALTVLFVAAGIGYGIYWATVASKRETTDNAYVGGNVVTLTSQVTGTVTEIRADETQLVKAGDDLVRLDPADATVALRQAEAKLGETVRDLKKQYANVDQYEVILEQRRIDLKKARADYDRRAPLAAEQLVAAEEVAHAKEALDNAQVGLDVAQKQLEAARAGVSGVDLIHHPGVLAAKSNFVQAWLTSRRNAIPAPVTGYVAKRGVQVGARVTPGTTLMTIVPLDQLWVDANFKESELKNIRIGQKAKAVADVYGSKVEYHGTVIGLAAGTGSAFSLLPAQNATGNWIKVVQRVPVRIALDAKELSEHPLRVGLSMEVEVDTENRDGTVLATQPAARPLFTTKALEQPLPDAEKLADDIIARNATH
ncbi:HlyD family secretion protein [Chitiniphilus eburneus]|uniref:HlyD family efflux transporter periplasmic adaptor subunit n=1 Tax=Chitiniphilus eburneus TaxID=2571148 RepID=A0A4U0PPD3_9NEIS|nr:efflux RND transporter periplasmic adaptor subunit [Chitiniphilus eburneus]TJZ70111.1 HlyD family efflux transporter periplasmic adaptor subunit [Chitiniphilus eburneus]